VSLQRYYVYYRVRADAVEPAVASVRALLRRWKAQVPALRSELLRRDDAAGEAVTLMEVLAGATPEQHAAFEAEAARELVPWLVGERHVECFRPCA
jgi:Domain of unknown function (DUF4936)